MALSESDRAAFDAADIAQRLYILRLEEEAQNEDEK